MRASAKLLLLMGGFNPYRAPGIVARYNVNTLSSLIYDGSDRIGLFGDLSGNSPSNVFVLNGASGNRGSFTALTAIGTGNFSVSAKVSVDALGGANQAIIGSAAGGVYLRVTSTGAVQMVKNGGTAITVSSFTLSAMTPSVVSYVRSGTTGTYYLNGVAANSETDSNDYTAGIATIGSLDASNAPLAGSIAWVRVYSGALSAAQISADAGGVAQTGCVFNADISLVSKLATSFTESSSNAATVTINSTGDLGARVCGARDIVMLTVAKKLTLSNVAGFWQALANGTSQYAASAPFSLAQPYAVDVVLTQQTWTINDVLIDGRSADTGELFQDTTTPRLSMYAGSVGPTTTQVAVARKTVITMIFDGASSYIVVNGNTPISGNAGALTPNGITLAAVASGSANGNVSFNEIIVRSGATVRDLALALKINRALVRKNAVS